MKASESVAPALRRTNAQAVPLAPAGAPTGLGRDATAAPPSAGAADTIALLQAHSLASAVHAEIERRILDGTLAPGSKLTEAALAEQLGVSRGPVREALRSLEEAGLVRQEKNRGAFVRSIPLDEAAEIYDLRALLDEAVGRQLAQTIKPEQLKVLRGMVDQMERVVKDGHNTSASDQYHRLNLAFHDQLVACVGNRKLLAMYQRVVKELSLLRRLNLAGGRQIPVSVSEHRAILKAIATGDVEGAGQALRDHVLESKERSLRAHGPANHEPAVPAPPAGTRKPKQG